MGSDLLEKAGESKKPQKIRASKKTLGERTSGIRGAREVRNGHLHREGGRSELRSYASQKRGLDGCPWLGMSWQDGGVPEISSPTLSQALNRRLEPNERKQSGWDDELKEGDLQLGSELCLGGDFLGRVRWYEILRVRLFNGVRHHQRKIVGGLALNIRYPCEGGRFHRTQPEVPGLSLRG